MTKDEAKRAYEELHGPVSEEQFEKAVAGVTDFGEWAPEAAPAPEPVAAVPEVPAEETPDEKAALDKLEADLAAANADKEATEKELADLREQHAVAVQASEGAIRAAEDLKRERDVAQIKSQIRASEVTIAADPDPTKGLPERKLRLGPSSIDVLTRLRVARMQITNGGLIQASEGDSPLAALNQAAADLDDLLFANGGSLPMYQAGEHGALLASDGAGNSDELEFANTAMLDDTRQKARELAAKEGISLMAASRRVAASKYVH